ncbi:MAG TPA: FG-GAP-like repeat-containing protein [Saprospiraceae bacterium]|nr:FG-GAP-like repeat-containing protein [Saprospiraceae bacterium]
MKHIFHILLLFPWCLGAQSHFTKITDTTNPAVTFANTPALYKGVVWIDIDHDNWPDLFVSQRFLFRNDRNGNFTQLTDLNGATGGQNAAGSSWGDLDNDGHLDCITTSAASNLHRNNGDNTFMAGTASLPGLSNYSGWDCALADADNNGRLDLTYVHACCSFHPNGPFPCRFYLQNTDGSFAKISGYEFTDDSTQAYTIPTWSDYDLDGDMDLFIGSGPAQIAAKPDFNYRNLLKENGTFSLERLTGFPFKVPQDGQTYNFVDYDNDGDLDICLTNYSQAPTRFYRNNNGNYLSVNTPFTITVGHLANCWGDMDNDGDLDVLITEDGVPTVKMYRNNGDTTFSAAVTAGVANGNACGIAFADYDNDGDLDFYTNGASTARTLFQNDTLAGNRRWAQFTLEGVQSNRSAIGALLRLKATIGGKAVWQIREITAHNSFQGQSDLRQHFGLGDAAKIDSLVVRWPSGTVQVFSNLAYNNFYKLVENENIGVIVGTTEPGAEVNLKIQPNPVSREFEISAGEKIAAVQVFDSTGRIVAIQQTAFEQGVRIGLYGNPAPGAYFVRVQLEDGRSVTKQVIKF